MISTFLNGSDSTWSQLERNAASRRVTHQKVMIKVQCCKIVQILGRLAKSSKTERRMLRARWRPSLVSNRYLRWVGRKRPVQQVKTMRKMTKVWCRMYWTRLETSLSKLVPNKHRVNSSKSRLIYKLTALTQTKRATMKTSSHSSSRLKEQTRPFRIRIRSNRRRINSLNCLSSIRLCRACSQLKAKRLRREPVHLS